MSFAVALTTDHLPVDAGSASPLSFKLTNTSTEAEYVEVFVEGIDPDWVTLPSTGISIQPNMTVEDRVLIRPHRQPESLAGTYNLQLRFRSVNSGDSQVLPVILEVKPFHQLSMEATPKRQTVGGFDPKAEFQVKVLNLSNVEHQLQFFASEPENRFTYEFDLDKITIGPGQERDLVIEARPKKKSLLSGSRLENISLSCRSIAFPNIAAYTQAQVEHRPVVPTVPAVAAVILGLLGYAWWSALPRAPQVDVFELSRSEIMVGESVNVVYRVQGAKKINLKSGDGMGTSSVQPSGEWTYTPKAPGTYEILMVAEGGLQARRTLSLKVSPAPESPKPVIEEFSVSPRQIETGGTFTIRYKFNEHVARATLQPLGYTIDVRKESFSFPPSTVGPIMLELVAENVRGERDSKRIQVEVVSKARAVIQTFRVEPSQVPIEDARVLVRWSTTGAVAARLKYEGKTVDVDPNSGEQELTLTKSGAVTLILTDENNRTLSRTVNVTVTSPTPQPDDSATTVDPPVSTPPTDSTRNEVPPR